MKIAAIIPPGSDEPVSFKTCQNNKRRQHVLVAWRFYDDGSFEPVLLPEPPKGAELTYEIGQHNPAAHLWKR